MSRQAAGAVTLARTRLLLYLLEAHETALDLQQPAWNFACQLHCLLQAGMTENALRWLLQEKLAAQRLETTTDDGPDRTYRDRASLNFRPESCFLLTRSGIALAASLRVPPANLPDVQNDEPRVDSPHAVPKPRFDTARRILFAGDHIVKQFRIPAENQELILTAFQEDDWPPHLDDPLPADYDIESAKRLQHAIYRLNTRQENRLIRFEGNGKGNGVKWRWIGGRLEVE